MFSARLTAAAVLAATSLALPVAPALAKGGGTGGGGGGNGTTPLPAPPAALLCPEYATDGWIFQPDGSTNFANEIPGVLCVVVHASLSNTLSLVETRVGTGWSPTVKSAGGGSSDRVDVEVTNLASGERHEILVEPGKTVIR